MIVEHHCPPSIILAWLVHCNRVRACLRIQNFFASWILRRSTIIVELSFQRGSVWNSGWLVGAIGYMVARNDHHTWLQCVRLVGLVCVCVCKTIPLGLVHTELRLAFVLQLQPTRKMCV